MLILFLNVVHYDKNHLKADHVQPKTSLFTSGNQHPPRFGHAVYLGVIKVDIIIIYSYAPPSPPFRRNAEGHRFVVCGSGFIVGTCECHSSYSFGRMILNLYHVYKCFSDGLKIYICFIQKSDFSLTFLLLINPLPQRDAF